MHGTVQLIEERQKPIRGQPRENPLIFRIADTLRRYEAWLKKIYAEEKAEGRKLQKRGQTQKVATGQQLCGEPLHGEYRADKECAGSEYRAPIRRERPDDSGEA